MSDARRCPRCGKTGYVRVERVIKGAKAVSDSCCGACGHMWQEMDEAPETDGHRND